MKKIWLKNVRKYTLIDDEDLRIVEHLTWYMHHSGYAYARFRTRTLALHKLILWAPDGLEIDHINQNKLDNRRKNLRIVTKAQNRFNRKAPANSKTGYKGVHFHRKNRRWVAYIGKTPRVYLGSFSSAKEAAVAYNQAAKERYGKYACLNKI